MWLQKFGLNAQNMFARRLYDTLNGYQTQRLCIFLRKWNLEEVYPRFLINNIQVYRECFKTEKEEKEVLCEIFFSGFMHFQ